MANIDLRFIDRVVSDDFIRVKKTDLDFGQGIKISGEQGGEPFIIVLDKSTAIRFAKTLRTEINKITESEVGNA